MKYRFVILAALVLILPTSSISDSNPQWVLLPEMTIWKILNGTDGGPIKKGDVSSEAHLVSSDTTSWPDGRQALITYYEQDVFLFGKLVNRVLFRCIDYTDASMRPTGSVCYELRNPDYKAK